MCTSSSVCGPELSFLLGARASARARQRAGCPRGSDGLPFASLRVPSGARVLAVRHNSLRSLRSLRSNKVPQVRGRSARVRAPAKTLRSSAAPIRPEGTPPAALRAMVVVFEATNTHIAARKSPGAALTGRFRRRREAQGLGPRAYSRASSADSLQVSERSERSERSEFCSGPQDRASQGTPRAARSERRMSPGSAAPGDLLARKLASQGPLA
jgi:hypothetical protein